MTGSLPPRAQAVSPCTNAVRSHTRGGREGSPTEHQTDVEPICCVANWDKALWTNPGGGGTCSTPPNQQIRRSL